jgi:hypothetical protein
MSSLPKFRSVGSSCSCVRSPSRRQDAGPQTNKVNDTAVIAARQEAEDTVDTDTAVAAAPDPNGAAGGGTESTQPDAGVCWPRARVRTRRKGVGVACGSPFFDDGGLVFAGNGGLVFPRRRCEGRA